MATFEIKPDEEGDPAFFINGDFQASWNARVKMPEMGTILNQMFKMAYDQGARDRGLEIKKLLG